MFNVYAIGMSNISRTTTTLYETSVAQYVYSQHAVHHEKIEVVEIIE